MLSRVLFSVSLLSLSSVTFLCHSIVSQMKHSCGINLIDTVSKSNFDWLLWRQKVLSAYCSAPERKERLSELNESLDGCSTVVL